MLIEFTFPITALPPDLLFHSLGSPVTPNMRACTHTHTALARHWEGNFGFTVV